MALPERLSLDDALAFFRAHGLDLLIAEAAVESAQGDVRAAGAVPNPAVGASYSHVFTYNPSDPSCSGPGESCTADGFLIDLNDQTALSDSLFGKRGLRLKVARAALAAAKMGRADAQRTLEFQVKHAYIQAVQARDDLDFALEVQRSSDQTFALTRTRLEKGAISEVDEAKVEAAKLAADQAVDSATQALRGSKVALAFLLGVRGALPDFHVDQDLPKFTVPPRLAAATRDSLLAAAYQNRPDLRAIQLQHQRATASIELARRQLAPALALDLNFAMNGSGGAGTNAPLTPPTLSVGVSAPLPLFYQYQGEIQKASADAKTQAATWARTEAQVAADVESALSSVEASRKLLERMQSRLLERVKFVLDKTQVQYEKGAASLLEFLDARRQYIAINQEFIQELYGYWDAVFALEQAVGMELR